MAWIKLKSSITNKEILMPESAYKNFHKSNSIFTVIEEQPKQEKKQSKSKEDIENVEDTQLDNKNEINPSGKGKKKTGV